MTVARRRLLNPATPAPPPSRKRNSTLVTACEESYSACEKAPTNAADMIKHYDSGDIQDFAIVDQAV